MVQTRDPRVSLITFTQNAIPLMCYVRRVMHAPVPDTLEEFIQDHERWLGMSINDYFDKVLLNDGMPTFLEFVSLVFKLENVSRALTHQLVRHRIGFSYSQQSMRCVPAGTFADEGMYHLPDTVDNKEYLYQGAMKTIQNLYNDLLSAGISIQDARGVLPTNIHTTIMFSCSLRAFIGMANKRLCRKAQGEFQQIAKLMVHAVIDRVDPRLRKWLGSPCVVNNHCMMKSENEQQLSEGKLTGKQNTDHVCEYYQQYFVK